VAETSVLPRVLADLRDEHRSLDAIVSSLDEAAWDKPTPAEGWSVRDQISHLAFFDEAAAEAVSAPDRFIGGLDAIARDPVAFMEGPLIKGRAGSTNDVLGWWRGARAAMLDVFETVDPDVRVPWYGPPMKPASFISARLMETWAHGQDVADASGVVRPPTDRLRHIAYLGFRARPYSYAANGMTLPDAGVRVELRGPEGDAWIWGEGDSVVSGDAIDFCLVVTQRRHLQDTNVRTVGDAAREWISIAQAFAGPPGAGRRPGQFPKRGAATE
jgi:uncharacterized protein (TIGR03084 family)